MSLRAWPRLPTEASGNATTELHVPIALLAMEWLSSSVYVPANTRDFSEHCWLDKIREKLLGLLELGEVRGRELPLKGTGLRGARVV